MLCHVFHVVDLGLFYKTRVAGWVGGCWAQDNLQVGHVVQKLTFEVIKMEKRVRESGSL